MIKFVYNGIKDEQGKLYKADFSKGCHKDGEDIITIYARDYEDLPRVEGLQVENDSDIMTDYFEKDRIEVRPENKFYEQVLEAWKQQEIHRAKMTIKSSEKEIQKCNEKIELYKGLDNYVAVFQRTKDFNIEIIERAKNNLEVLGGKQND